MNQIKVKGLEFGYYSETLIRGIDLSVDKGDMVMILGENGSGKSTFLKLLLGELKPDKGEITIFDQKLSTIQSFKEIGYVPQVQNFNQVTFPITVLELVVLSLYHEFGFFKIPRKRHKDKAIEILNKMGLQKYIHTPFNELSGGLKQRTMISRALMNNPSVLILDEPTAGVDKESKQEFLTFIEKINKEEHITVIIVTHEIGLMKEYISNATVYEMKEGRLENVGV